MKLFTKGLLFVQMLSISVAMLGSYRLPNFQAQTSSLATHEGEGRFHKKVTFNSNVTISSANALTIATPDALEVHAKTDDQISITAESGITGITDAKFPTLTTATSGTGVVIDGTVIINGTLTMNVDDVNTPTAGGTLEIDGDLIVKGEVLIEPLCTLTVKGDVIFDGDGQYSVGLYGNVTVLGQTYAGFDGTADGFDGSENKKGNLTVRNAYTATSTTVGAPTLYVKDGAVIIGATGSASTVAVDGSLIIEDAFADTASAFTNPCYVDNCSLTIGDDFIVRRVKGGYADDQYGAFTILDSVSLVDVGRDIIFEEVEATDKAGAGAVAVDIKKDITAHGSIIIKNNIGGPGTNNNGGDAVLIEQNAIVRAYQDIIVAENVGGLGGVNGIGQNGGEAFRLDSGTLQAANLYIRSNVGGAGGTGTTGGLGQIAIDISDKLAISSDIVITDNTGGAGGESTAGTGAVGGIAVNIGGSVSKQAKLLSVSHNTGGVGGAGSTGNAGGQGGKAVNISYGGTETNVSDVLSINNNIAGAAGQGGISTDGAVAVAIENVIAKNSITIAHNAASAGLTGSDPNIDGANGGNAVDITDSLKANNIIIQSNQGGNGSNASGTGILNGGAGGLGVSISNSSDTIFAYSSMSLIANLGGNGGALAGTGNTGDGGAGAELAETVIVDSIFIARDNQGGNTDTGGIAGDGFILSGTLTVNSNKVITGNLAGTENGGTAGLGYRLTGTCNEPVIAPQGKTVYTTNTTFPDGGSDTNDVCVFADLTVNASQSYTIDGNLIVKGSVSIGAGGTLTVNGDVLFDGQGLDARTVSIAGTLSACNVTIANYGDSTNGTTGSAVSLTGTIMASYGTVLIKNNRSATANAVRIASNQTLEGQNIIFANNSSMADIGVNITNNTGATGPFALTASNDLRFIRNWGTGTTGGTGPNGVSVSGNANGSTGDVEVQTASLFVDVNCNATGDSQNISFGANTTLTDIYGATIAQHVRNVSDACSLVDLDPSA